MTALPIFSLILGGFAVALAATQSSPASLNSGPTNIGAVLASAAFPKPTIDGPVRAKPFDTDAPAPSQPAACEAAASLTIDPTLVRLVGRCFA
jgi:hypothetical protein